VTTPTAAPPAPRLRQYDKGERRRKHVAPGGEPQLVFDNGSPHKVIGKCPTKISDAEREELLERAVPLPNNDRERQPPKKI
jgi:hypothetical protein